nr:hypothetical protein [Tanacetum cinerariifolium]
MSPNQKTLISVPHFPDVQLFGNIPNVASRFESQKGNYIRTYVGTVCDSFVTDGAIQPYGRSSKLVDTGFFGSGSGCSQIVLDFQNSTASVCECQNSRYPDTCESRSLNSGHTNRLTDDGPSLPGVVIRRNVDSTDLSHTGRFTSN